MKVSARVSVSQCKIYEFTGNNDHESQCKSQCESVQVSVNRTVLLSDGSGGCYKKNTS